MPEEAVGEARGKVATTTGSATASGYFNTAGSATAKSATSEGSATLVNPIVAVQLVEGEARAAGATSSGSSTLRLGGLTMDLSAGRRAVTAGGKRYAIREGRIKPAEESEVGVVFEAGRLRPGGG